MDMYVISVLRGYIIMPYKMVEVDGYCIGNRIIIYHITTIIINIFLLTKGFDKLK